MAKDFAPLRGRVVVDFTTLMPGPYAGLLLAGLGCRVLKVEPPAGDPGRWMNPHGFAVLNAGKESVVVDLKAPDAAPVLAALLRLADAVLVSTLPGPLARLGLDAAGVRRHNPRAVHCHVLGWSGPLRDMPAHDIDIFAGAGAVAVSPAAEYPLGLPFADLATGALAALQVAAALAVPAEPGPALEVSMASALQSWVALGAKVSTAAQLAAPPAGPPRIGGYGLFPGSDGRRFSVGAVEDRFWRTVVRLCDLPAEWATLALDERRARADEINAVLAGRLAAAPAEGWITRLRAEGVPAAPVATLAEAFTPESGADAVRVLHDGRVEVSLPNGLPPTGGGPAPALGAQTDAVLRELGLADRAVAG